MAAAKEKIVLQTDSIPYNPNKFIAADYKNLIKKVENYLDRQIGMASSQSRCVIRPKEVDLQTAPEEYAR